jgi:hypothetical protein
VDDRDVGRTLSLLSTGFFGESHDFDWVDNLEVRTFFCKNIRNLASIREARHFFAAQHDNQLKRE